MILTPQRDSPYFQNGIFWLQRDPTATDITDINIYGVVCVQLAHFSLGDWEDISIVHGIIIIKSEVSSLPIIIFSVVVILRCLLHHILSLIAYTLWENRNFVFIIVVQFMMSAKSRIRFGLQIVFVCLYITSSYYHHCANLSEDIERIKCLPDIFVECMSKIKHIFSVIHYTIYGAVCFQFTDFHWDDRENIHFVLLSSNRKYYPLFRVRSWNNGMRCMSLFILMNSWYGQIASWDIRVLVVFAPNLALCHRHAA